VLLNESEERGRQLFFREFDPTGKVKGAECFHCHAAPFFTNDRFMNNGLDGDASFVDFGRERVTGLATDRAKFKVPTLRNIARTAPYMHDGRFGTLEDVVHFYNTGVTKSSTVDPLMQFNLKPGLNLSVQDEQDLVAYLKTLTDETFLTNPLFRMP
jgi:cytochrome c peroxidase